MNGPKVRFWLGIALAGFHLCVSTLFVFFGRSLFIGYYDFSEFIMITIILVQSSLLGLWLVLGKSPYWVRLPVSFLLLLWSTYSFLSLEQNPDNPEIYVSVLIMMFGQFFCIAGMMFIIQMVLKFLKIDTHIELSTNFSMGAMLLVVTLIAAAFGTGNIVVQQLGLTIEVFTKSNNNLWVLPFLGIFNVLSVILMLPALWVYRWRMKLILFFPLITLVGCTGFIEAQSVYLVMSDHPPWFLYTGLNVGQATIFYITVFPLWRWKTPVDEENVSIVSDEVINEELEGVTV
ncbi:MAG: hypothetical protein COA78_26695 [Blastopirellula sp.]|nr:MAG: hypothetical protein COA78_26695 [Blastopirellula sp.]